MDHLLTSRIVALCIVARGYLFFDEARGQLLRYIPASGVGQGELVEQASMSKQAVQQQLDLLEEEGVIERVPDPNDAKKKYIQYTLLGLEALKEGNAVKQSITARYKKLLGKERMLALMEGLDIIIKTAKA